MQMKFYDEHIDEEELKQEYLKLNSRCRYKTPEELEQKISEYILGCKAERRPLTISGLATYLGLTTTTLRRYEKDYPGTEYAEIISIAKQMIETYTEEALFDSRSCSGAKFSLQNNFGWTEKQEVSGETVVRLEDVLNQ